MTRTPLLLCVCAIAVLAGDATAGSKGYLFPVERGGKWGYIDRTGKVVVPPKYDQALEFSDGMGAVRDGKKWGYIDAMGTVRIPPQYEVLVAFPFCGPSARIYDPENVAAFVKASGEVVRTRIWEKVEACLDGVMAVRQSRKWGYLSADGKLLVEPQFDEALQFGEGLGTAKKSGKWGFVDMNGSWVIPPQFDDAGRFSEGLAPVNSGGLWGYIDRSGKMVIPPAYSFAYPFSEGRGRVLTWTAEKLPRTGFVDRTGKMVVAPAYPAASDFKHGRAVVRIGLRSGYIDLSGRVAVKPVYEYAGDFDGGLAQVKVLTPAKKLAVQYIDPAGKVVWSGE